MLDRMRELEDSLGLYLFAKDKNLKYIYCNEILSQVMGLDSPQEVIGKTDFDLFPSNIAQIYQRGDAFVLGGGVFLNCIETLPEKRQSLQISVSKRLLKNRMGHVIGVAGSALQVDTLDLHTPMDGFLFRSENNRYFFKIDGRNEYFTRRELDVLKHLVNGMTSKQIASSLRLSPRTAEDYIGFILQKLQCFSKYEVREKLMALGIYQDPRNL